jgi:hypothetical protein
MDEEFESFVVTNPDLVDPGIDVSGLRTTTDANILGNITDFPGIQYEAYNPSRLSDLMNLYSRGLPTLATDTAQIPGAVDTLVDVSGGGGQDQVTGDSVAGFDPGVTPGPSGFIGLDPDMDIDPRDINDYATYDPPELGGVDGMSGGQATPGAEFADQNPYGGTGTIDDLGADSFPEYQEPTVANLGSTVPGITDYVEGIDLTTGLPETPAIDTTPVEPPSLGFGNAYEEPMSLEDVIGTDANVGFVDAPATELGSQINSAFENVKDQGVGAIESFKDTLVGLGGKVKEGFDNVIEFGETSIDVGKTLATGAINYIGRSIFGPVGAVLGTALGALGIEGGRSDLSDRLGGQYGMDDIGRLTSGPMEGYSVDSAFGDIRQATVDRIETRKENNLDTTELEQFLSEIDYLGGDPVGANTDIDIDTGNVTGDASVAEQEVEKEKQQAFADIQNQIGQSLHGGDDNKDEGPSGTPSFEGFDSGGFDPAPAPADISDRGRGQNNGGGDGGGGSSGGGTHVCTASYANNLITILDFKSLKKYGIKLRRNDKYLMKAYDWFGPKLAAAVKKGKLVNFAKHSTSMWKYEQTKEDVSFKIKFMSRFHKIITRPILRALGALLTIKEKLTK